jgi:hypothetical protein
MAATANADSPATSFFSFTPSLDPEIVDQLAGALNLADDSIPAPALLDDASSSSLSCPPAEPLTDVSEGGFSGEVSMREDEEMLGKP